MEETTISFKTKKKPLRTHWPGIIGAGMQKGYAEVNSCKCIEHFDNKKKIYTEILLCVLCTDIQTLPMSGRPCAQLI